MQWSVKINKKIRELFKDNEELMNRLLSDDSNIRNEAIREIGLNSNQGFTSEEIICAYNNKKIDELYKKAKKNTEIRILFYELINEEPPKVLTKLIEK